MTQADFVQVQKFLSGVSYLASKQELIEHARSKSASGEALTALEEIPEREYSGPDQVSKAVAKS